MLAHHAPEALAAASKVRAAATELCLLTPEGELRQPLDSIDMVNLFVALEGLFQRPIPGELMAPEHFASVDALARVLQGV